MAASVAQAKEQSPFGQGEVEKAPATWKTFVLTTPSQLRPAPPGRNIRAPSGRPAKTAARQPPLTPERKARIAYWGQSPITHPWSGLLLKKIAQYDVSPARAARAIALVHVAMYDAVVASWDAKFAYNVPEPRQASRDSKPLVATPMIPTYPSEHAAVAAAAATVLSYLFPLDAKEFRHLAHEAAESRLYAGTNVPEDVEAGQTLGSQVGDLVVRRGQSDGSDQMYAISLPIGPGYWKPPLGGVMADPTAGSWQTWILADGEDVTLPPPPSPGSPAYQEEMDEMIAVSKHLTDKQKAIARFWVMTLVQLLLPDTGSGWLKSRQLDRLVTTPHGWPGRWRW